MTLPTSLPVALKDWAIVCDALASGRQIVLLRKGGIYESAGEFEVEHPRFLLFPTYLHQNLKMLKPADQAGFEARNAEPAQIRLAAAAEVTDIIQLHSRSQMDAVDDQHIWTAPLIDMRFNYRPENPLYLLLVRAYKLAVPTTVDNTPEFAGCKSWVPLGQDIPTAGAAPALTDDEYADRKASLLRRLST